jgi:cadmium resistance protein CadD (predicted permease)
MGKVGKTFTLDIQVLMWLADYAKKNNKKESAVVNALLNSAKRQSETWTCSICSASNDNDNVTCYVLIDGEFCKGVKA